MFFRPLWPPADAELAQGQGHVVGDHQHPLGGDLVKPGGLAHGLAGEVHVGGGLHEEHRLAADEGGVGEGSVLELLDGDLLPVSQLVNDQEAHVVAGPLVLGAGVAQADH